MYSLPPLPYDYSALEPHIDAQTMQIHHDKHHQAYVDNLNKALEGQEELAKLDISELIVKLDKVPENIRAKVRNNAGGHFNHSFFWTIMAPARNASHSDAGGPKPERQTMNSDLATAINTSFGSLDKFKEQFTNAALARFGSGWVWLTLAGGKLKIEDSANQDNPLMNPPASATETATILLGLDVWEHAYYLKYQNKRADYVSAWWNVVNWQRVSELYQPLELAPGPNPDAKV